MKPIHGETKTRLHKIWECMHERCEYEKHRYYAIYGGRGISVCTEWNDYTEFAKWARNNGYAETLTIDRKDGNGNYEPSNCRWVTMKQQQNNRRNNHTICYNGERHTIAEWSEILGIGKTTIKERLKNGWSEGKALTAPIRARTRGYRPSHTADMRKGENDG